MNLIRIQTLIKFDDPAGLGQPLGSFQRFNGTRAGEEARLLCAEERMKLIPGCRLSRCDLNLLAQVGTPLSRGIHDEDCDE